MQTDQYSHIMPIAQRPDLIMVRGAGSWIWDNQGRSYLDLIQGWAVNCLGHSPEVLSRSLCEQSKLLINPSPAFYNAPHIELANLLCSQTRFDHIFFANSGAEANEGAIKLARKWGSLHRAGAYEIITLSGSFHGRTLATMSASGKSEWEHLYKPKVPGFKMVNLAQLTNLANLFTERTVAVMLEPIQGEAGVIPLSHETLRSVRKVTRENNILLIIDEIQTGVGRTGCFLASDHASVDADILTLGKGLGGGVPIAALLTRENVSCFEPGDQGGTFNGNPLVCAASLSVVKKILSPSFLETVRNRSHYFKTKLRELSHNFSLGEVRGEGLLLALNLLRPIGKQVVDDARDQGLLINSPKPSILRFMPALNIEQTEIESAVEILSHVLTKIP